MRKSYCSQLGEKRNSVKCYIEERMVGRLLRRDSFMTNIFGGRINGRRDRGSRIRHCRIDDKTS